MPSDIRSNATGAARAVRRRTQAHDALAKPVEHAADFGV